MGGNPAGQAARSPAAAALSAPWRAAQVLAPLAAAAPDAAAAEAAWAALPQLGAAGLPGLQQLCQTPIPACAGGLCAVSVRCSWRMPSQS